jgi:hypothetical protein
MSVKMSTARRCAFLKALRATGNQALAAECAKVSRRWVTLHRKIDPEFRRESDAAIAEARASVDRLRAEGATKPPSGWGYLDGEELVVRGSNGRRLQIARARLHQWTPRLEDRFLATLAATCNVRAACAEAGMSGPSAYGHRERWPGFARRWDEAVQTADIRLAFALVEHGANPFSSLDPPAPVPIPPMSVDDMLHSLYMHQRQTAGTGGRPGRAAREPTGEEAVRAVLEKVEAIERARALSEADKARDREDYARRRRSGQALRRGSGQALRRRSG